jgi:hypothetical protein
MLSNKSAQARIAPAHRAAGRRVPSSLAAP